ncbi:glycerol-3-phosphate dehydrogenase [Paenibacillus eucommiae]|uniref:Glycerol-3-phosphate dehydrogenase n=1 Tax=Paenibacillus eucommiae TaxID=1355755 RepID=A0ABS4IW41_9BACL|nr:glycerol-3-phosphate dehydrogenase [Paenibacillus eucommiae]
MKNVKAVATGMLYGLFGFAALPFLLIQSIIEMFG